MNNLRNQRFSYLNKLCQHIAATAADHLPLLKPGVLTHPIPFFGNPSTAEFATIGVNPSATEFAGSRWPPMVTAAELEDRLTRYFNNPSIPPHRWFGAYETCLSRFGHSYVTDTVHFDLSARATKAMGSVPREAFLSMVSADLPWFLEAIKLGTNLQGAILTGSVTGKYYADEFLKTHLPAPYAFTLSRRFEDRRRGATSLYLLEGSGLKLPVLFCSTSPSADRGVRLTREMKRILPSLNEAGFCRGCG